MKRRHLAIGLALAGMVVLGAVAGVWSRHRAASASGPDPAALRLFAMSLPDADGAPRALKAWQGKLLIVNFWATWCVPCVEEMPELQQFVDQVGSDHVALIGVGVDDADRVRDFRSQHKLRFPLLVAGFDGMQLAQTLGDSDAVLPYTALISPDGRVLEQHAGRVQLAQLRGWLAEHGAH